MSGEAYARVPSQTPKRRLDGTLARSLGAPAARGATAGVFAERGGTPIISLNADRPFTPASLTKIATTVAALSRFGVEHRFATRAVAAAATTGGVIGGDLILVGGGDPTFASRAYAAKRYLPKPNDPAPVTLFPSGFVTTEDLAQAVRNAGVRAIEGNLLVDETLFDSARTQPGWIASYQKKGSVEVGNLSAMTINEGFADIEGDIVAPEPGLVAGRAFADALRAAGVTLSGTVRYGRAPARARQIARVSSPTMTDLVGYTNRYSVNYCAEMLLKGLGARFGGAGTTEAGVRVLTQTLSKAQIPMEGFRLSDGSGLSVNNLITPRTIAALLRRAVEDPTEAGVAMRSSMPVAGAPGTLLRRLREAPAGGNLRGKTALIRGVRGMAGWVTGTDGSVIVYVTLFNDAASARLLTSPIDLIGFTLARFPYL